MNCVLGFETAAGNDAPERVWVDAPGCHRISATCKDELLAVMHDLRPRRGARLVLFGESHAEVAVQAAQRQLLDALARRGRRVTFSLISSSSASCAPSSASVTLFATRTSSRLIGSGLLPTIFPIAPATSWM